MFCENCGTLIKEGFQFCGACGWKVPAAPPQPPRLGGAPQSEGFCAACGARLAAGAKFCEHCGAAAPSPRDVPAPGPAVSPPAPAPVSPEAEPAGAPFDRALVFRPGQGVAGCYLYREGVLEGIFTDVRGLFMEDFTAFLARRCAGIDIIEENGPEGEG